MHLRLLNTFLRVLIFTKSIFVVTVWMWTPNRPSEVLMVTGVELGVGLSMALVILAFFLHSNATWSLHSLWQFIPQSERARRTHNMSEQELDIWHLHTLTFFFEHHLVCKCKSQTFACSLPGKQIALRSPEGRGRGEKLWFWLQTCAARFSSLCATQNHTTMSADSFTIPAPHKTR